jgi:hypothetical protein
VVAHVFAGISEESNRQVLQVRAEHGDWVIPFGYVDLFERASAEEVDRLREAGHVGVKFIFAPRPYSDDAYMPIYERAAELGLPALFHTGWVAGTRGKRSLNMAPSELEPICKCWPEWKIMAAHLGNAWAHDAVGMMNWHKNLYYDLTGGFIRSRSPSWLRGLFLRQDGRNLRSMEEVVDMDVVGRLVFGTDNPSLAELLEFYMNFLAMLEVPRDIQDRIYYGNAAEILGIA